MTWDYDGDLGDGTTHGRNQDLGLCNQGRKWWDREIIPHLENKSNPVDVNQIKFQALNSLEPSELKLRWMGINRSKKSFGFK